MAAAGALLVLLGVLKIAGSFEGNSFLDLGNPLVPAISNRQVVRFAAVIEMLVGSVAFSRRFRRMSPWLTLWFVLILFFYRLALIAVHYDGPCGCLVGLTLIIPLSPHTQHTVSDVILLILMVVSAGTLLSGWIRRQRRVGG